MQTKPASRSKFEKRMGNHYREANDISARLDRTIAMYKGEPVYIAVQNAEILQLFDLDTYPNGRPFKVRADDPELDISSVELGYCNIKPNCPINGNNKGYAVWTFRHPQRQYRQGVDPQRIGIQSAVAGRNDGHASVVGYPMADMIKEIYPSVVEAVWMLSSGTHVSVAISAEVALLMENSGIITVAINRQNIGSLIPSEGRVYVKDHEFVWVIESLLSRFEITVDKFKGV